MIITQGYGYQQAFVTNAEGGTISCEVQLVDILDVDIDADNVSVAIDIETNDVEVS